MIRDRDSLGRVVSAVSDQEDYFWPSVRLNSNGCWEWSGPVNVDGYGRFSVNCKRVLAHRWIYQRFIRTLAPSETIDHLCRNRRCVNLDHLDPCSIGENVLRGEGLSAQRARQTHCIRGHEFTPQNTRITGRGTRACRACARLYWLAKKEKAA